MAFKKKTIRRIPPKTREFARIINELKSVLTRLEHRLSDIASLELDSKALYKAREFMASEKQSRSAPIKTEPLFLDNTPNNISTVTDTKPTRKRKSKKNETDNKDNEIMQPEPIGENSEQAEIPDKPNDIPEQ